MLRFVAFAWSNSEPQAKDKAYNFAEKLQLSHSNWTTTSTDSFVILHMPAKGIQLSTLLGKGIVVGSLFETLQEYAAPVPAKILDSDADRILASQGRELVEKFWGSYIAILKNASGETLVLRDPTGAIPCYVAAVGNIKILFSHIEDYMYASQAHLTVNWGHVLGFLHFSRLISDETGYEHVAQIQAGECLNFGGEGERREFYWRASDFCQKESVEDPHLAMKMLHHTIKASVLSWASRYENIVLELSGGLDSSIVLSCLGSAKNLSSITCLNMYTDARGGDERFYARKMAEHASAELIEIPFRADTKPLEHMFRQELLLSPTMVSLYSEAEDLREQLVRTRMANAIFSGRGGDQLFQRRKGNFIANEYVHRHGLDIKFLQVVLRTARLTRSSIWSVLAAGLEYRFTKTYLNPYSAIPTPKFVSPEALHLFAKHRLVHPWLRDAKLLPESKAQQIFDVIDCQNYFSMGSCEYADVIPALFSQPVIECVLRIPSYTFTDSGIDRALLRSAFSDQLPQEISQRTTKGDVVGYYQNLLIKNLPFLKSFLLDGVLMKENILDKNLLEGALTRGNILRGNDVAQILTCTKAEVWLRSVFGFTKQKLAGSNW